MKIDYNFKNCKISENIKTEISKSFDDLAEKYWFFTKEDYMHVQIIENKNLFYEVKIEIHLFKNGRSLFAKTKDKSINECIIKCKHKIKQQLTKIKELKHSNKKISS